MESTIITSYLELGVSIVPYLIKGAILLITQYGFLICIV